MTDPSPEELLVAPAAAVAVAPAARPSFSVVIAAYQAAGFVGHAVASALGQTQPPLEVIVCDDGSTDNIAAALAPWLDRITLLRQPNRGEGAAKNAAIKAASGDYVAVLDADDVFEPDRLELLGTVASRRPDLDILTTDAHVEIEGRVVGRFYSPAHPFEVDDQRGVILERNFIFGLVAARRVRLTEVGGFDETIRYTTDWDLWIRMLMDGSSVGLVAWPLARYRITERNMSSNRLAIARGEVETLTRAMSRAVQMGLEPTLRERLARSLQRHQQTLAVVEARNALLEASHDARRRALAIALSPAFGPRVRVKLGLSALSVSGAGRWLRRQEQRSWRTIGHLQVPRSNTDGQDAEQDGSRR